MLEWEEAMRDKWFWLAVVGIVLAAWMLRWDIYTIDRNGRPTGYAVDRLTGQLWLIDYEERVRLMKSDE